MTTPGADEQAGTDDAPDRDHRQVALLEAFLQLGELWTSEISCPAGRPRRGCAAVPGSILSPACHGNHSSPTWDVLGCRRTPRRSGAACHGGSDHAVLEEEPVLRDTPPFRADHVGSLLRPRPCCRPARTTPRARSTPRSCAASRTGGRGGDRAAARGRAALGHRRRVPSRVVAHGLHLPPRRHQQGPATTWRCTSRTPTASLDFTPAALRVDGRLGLSETIFGDDFTFLRDHVVERRRRPS